MKAFYVFIILIIIEYIFSVKVTTERHGHQAPAKKEAGNSSELSNEELEVLMKDYGLSKKDLGFLTDGSAAPGNGKYYNLDDSLKNILKKIEKKQEKKITPQELKAHRRKNREILKGFELNNADAFNLINLLTSQNLFTRMPIFAMNLINVFTS